jgi:hypothetical protein
MMSFNPATYWWQWMLDQMEEHAEGFSTEGVPRMSFPMTMAGQIAGLKAYAKMLSAAQESGSLETMNRAAQEMARSVWEAARKEQPAVTKAHLQFVRTMIENLEQEQQRQERQSKPKGKRRRA